MKEKYIVADNPFTVSVPDGLAAWKAIESHFRPFVSSLDATPVLEVDIKISEIPKCEGVKIYEPEFGGIGFITSCVWQLDDQSLVMYFAHISEPAPRLSMKMPKSLDRADIVLAPGGDNNDSYFLTHALMIAYMLSTCANGTLLFHCSSVVYDGRAYLFQGKSGTGKSTHVALWLDNIEGAELLNDDNPVVRFSADGTPMAYGSPWSGKTDCYRNVSAPVGAVVRVVRAKENELRRLTPLKGFVSLNPSIFFMPFMSEKLSEVRLRTIERLAMTVPCCEIHCRPDADAAMTSMRGLTALV